ncbi:carbohydrate ABC transporter permease [Dactylosporangium fulvum]|uniref:Carbohydrate ABC transporter permease n=1 Tax=Dactylosporangium fulvum TaxID=53359 RepID=A0ABY5VZE2_9ACTN|nr:carbohydrate ABC transporter permease [Dactylosporangium fulvum]UWP83118.1 carbohydrate ABC transporter permease [Dactylosporangium fulvum]
MTGPLTELPPGRVRPGRTRRAAEAPDRGIISTADRHRPGTRAAIGLTQVVLLTGVVVAALVPFWWLVKGAVSATQELLADPIRAWPSALHWANLTDAWTQLEVGHYLLNTVIYATGACAAQVAVATTAGYALSVLRPRFGGVLYGAILATLFIPGSVTLVALYLTIVDVPGFGVSIANTPLAIWLPAAAHAFNVLIAKQFFDALPRELFEAAAADGAGAFRTFWSIVLPMSRPMLAAVSILTLMAAWKDFLWPLVAMSDPVRQPLSVALPRLATYSDQAMLIAGLLISTLPPLIVFVVFQRYLVRGIGFSGLKG